MTAWVCGVKQLSVAKVRSVRRPASRNALAYAAPEETGSDDIAQLVLDGVWVAWVSDGKGFFCEWSLLGRSGKGTLREYPVRERRVGAALKTGLWSPPK
ncbi:unnamed protein product [Calypogeia fissa]